MAKNRWIGDYKEALETLFESSCNYTTCDRCDENKETCVLKEAYEMLLSLIK